MKLVNACKIYWLELTDLTYIIIEKYSKAWVLKQHFLFKSSYSVNASYNLSPVNQIFLPVEIVARNFYVAVLCCSNMRDDEMRKIISW